MISLSQKLVEQILRRQKRGPRFKYEKKTECNKTINSDSIELEKIT